MWCLHMWESSHYLSTSQNRSKRKRVLGEFYCNKLCVISNKNLITRIFKLVVSNQRMQFQRSSFPISKIPQRIKIDTLYTIIITSFLSTMVVI